MNAQDVVQLINDIRSNPQQDDKIHVLPLMCGTGKSTAISYLIRQTIEEVADTGNGLLVVTDRIDRMDDYMHPYDPDLKNYLMNHEDQVCIMTSDNIEEANRVQRTVPVLMMTTQRYFRLFLTEINEYLKWKGGRRPLVIIDEYPELMTEVELDNRNLAECEAAIANTFQKKYRIPPTMEIQQVKDEFYRFICELRAGVCGKRDNLHCFWSWLSDDDTMDGFSNFYDPDFEKVTEKRKEINIFGGGSHYEDIYTRYKAIRQLKNHNALVCQRKYKDGNYSDSMHLILDNYDLIHDIQAKVIILDGTADLSPQYLPERFQFSQNTNRRLDHLHIKLINYPTGKTALLSSMEKQEQLLDYVQLYFSETISDSNKSENEWALFTYLAMERAFKKQFGRRNVEHFGNIKGKNDFREARHIFQIGLNRYPDEIYYLYYLAKNPEARNRYSNMENEYNYVPIPTDYPPDAPPDYVYDGDVTYERENIKQEVVLAQSDEIDAEMQDLKGETRDIMNRMLLAEIEQNLFRGIIRNSDSEEDFTFHLFINTDNYADLIDLMRQRYEPLGATIDFAPFSLTVALQKSLNRKGSTYIQRLVRWHDSLPYNAEYTPALIREKIGMTNTSAVSSYQQMLHHNPAIRILMNEEKQKRGLYKKENNWILRK